MDDGAGQGRDSGDRQGGGGPTGLDGPQRNDVPINGREPRLSAQPTGADGPGADGPDPEEPIWVKHRPPFYYQPRVVLTFLLVVVAIGSIALSSRHPKFPPPASCTHPAVRVGVSHVKTGYPLYWAATGGAGRYAVTLGASAVRVRDGQVTVTDTESMAGRKATVVRQPSRLTGCRWLGHLDMPMPSGEYSLRLYRIDGDRATLVGKTRVDSDG
ncbi:MAG: hypothetical protein WCA46_12095 [Actinocatenispora sp.]